ncbi:glycosyltransferase [uncultured Fusobacterium sp.]|uniref:glycosyltransferase n=1 Tax=uncultured Fusobacterium sp. TaxID=159267 RepID=UPI002804E6CF|nr:glycosyltransferase [uncultured Fusobacterium sp.]
MNKLLYIAPIPIDFDNLDGVPKKILCQAQILQKSFEVDIIFYFKKNVFLYKVGNKKLSILGKASSKLSVLKKATEIHFFSKYQYTYIRYPRSDYYFLKLLKHFKRKGIKITVEIPTYPYDKEGFETIKGKIINLLDRFFRKKIYKYVDRIITYSKDKKIFDIPTINTINGIDFDKVEYDIEPIDIKHEIILIAVSGMFRVHGYERLITGLYEYYKEGGMRKIQLKLIGNGDEILKYKKLVKKYKLEKNVIFYGTRFGEELNELYKGNAVGINSLAIHRQGLKEESTLKTKEYAAKGLPIVSSSYVDAFSEKGNIKYVMRVSPDESAININELVSFVDKIYEGKEVKNIRESIRNDAKQICDISYTMKPVIEFYLNS